MSADGTGFLPKENVLDYPRPPRIEPVPCVLRVEFAGGIVAETRRGLWALETHHAPTYYFPLSDVFAELIAAEGRTFCEWKGVARYFDMRLNGKTVTRAAWSYDTPSSTFADLAGYVAFYPGRMDACFVGGLRVTAQPGDFYGGWVTPNLVGPIKGAPGTRHW
jgi:uncharacterized protein (DUF427 family)